MLFTFPSRYWCTIGRQGVFRLGGWSPHLRTGFHGPRPTHGPTGALRLRGCHPLRRSVPAASASPRPATGLLRFRSPLLTESRLMSSPPGTEMFQFPGFASPAYAFGQGYPQRGGLPHSDIRGSTLARSSPRLIAACHVLPRLLAPRHPPDALLLRGPRLSPTTAAATGHHHHNRSSSSTAPAAAAAETQPPHTHSHTTEHTQPARTHQRARASPHSTNHSRLHL